MKDTYTFSNENGTFVCFLHYENEEDFTEFLSFVCDKLRVDMPPITETPYSLIAVFEYSGVDLSATYETDAGCNVGIPPDTKVSAKTIVEKCYGHQ